MVKRFFQEHGDKKTHKNKYGGAEEAATAPFEIVTRKAIAPTPEELENNPRARSAKLRVARRTDVVAEEISAQDIAMPLLEKGR
jgi:16S rRNA (cytosine1402-N4)-methyltransferase